MPHPHDDEDDRPVPQDPVLQTQRLASIGALTAGVAHHLGNRLGGILMAAQYAATALDREDARAVVAKALADIESDAKQCSDVLGELRRFAHHSPGERKPHDLAAIIRSAVELAEMSTPRSTATVRLDIDGALPRPVVDRVEICRALVDVLARALRSGSQSVRVHAAATGVGRLRIAVACDDLGAAAGSGEAAPELSLARAIMEAHGGTLDVASSAADGAIVSLDLPLPAGT